MKKILVPIDFSSGSINALTYALNFAETIISDIELLYVKKSKDFFVPEFFRDTDIYYGSKAIDYLKGIAEKYGKDFSNNLSYNVIEGKVYKAICEHAEKNNFDLIIMGAHGISGFEKLYIGSNAYRVVSHSKCPVLTIRSTYINTKIDKIILPIDITQETRQKVPFTVKIAKYFNAEIHLINVSESNTESVNNILSKYSSQVEEYIVSRNVKVIKDALIGSNITEITIEYALNNNANLISIMSEQAESTKNLWMGKYAQQMINSSPIPVLTFKTLK
ncbi:MAG: universal stress protein [Marinilabiliales bacterium]